MPDSSSPFAEEGDRAHDLAELCLSHDRNPEDYVGMELNGVPIDEEMAFNVGIFVDHCRRYIGDGWEHWVERKFSLGALNPPEPMFGTADFTAYNSTTHELKVADFKYGQGVVVEVKDNPQTLYYALGVALDLHPLPITKVTMTIVQPRVMHPDGIARSVEIDYLELIEFAGVLLRAARETQKPDAPLVPGDHCRFCPASGACPAQHARAIEIAQMDFAIEDSVPPAPATLPMEVIAEFLPKLDVLEDWIIAVRNHAREALNRGETVPGYKLVPTRPRRKWTDPAGAALFLEKESELPESQIYQPRLLRSPAQIEKAMGKAKFRKSPLAEVVTKESSGIKMVPDSDPTPALSVTAGTEFLALGAGDDTQEKQSGDSE